jgi:hypothetical protein
MFVSKHLILLMLSAASIFCAECDPPHYRERPIFRPQYGQESNRETMKTLPQMHAECSFDAEKHEDFVEIMPTGPFSTRIDLPVETTPHCKLEIDNRCLIALQQFPYPAQLLNGKPSGSVTLAGTITRAGTVDHIRVVKAESISASAAVQNLTSWRLEPGPRDESIHITYSYAIDNSLRRMDGMQVQWALPNAVSIRIPPE